VNIEDIMREAAEVYKELDNCYSRTTHDDINVIKSRIEEGNLKVTNDPALRKAVYNFAEEDTLIHEENLQRLLSEEAALTKFLPPEEQRPLNNFERFLYDGAIWTLHWALGHHDKDLVGCLVSEQFELDRPKIWLIQDDHVRGSKDIISTYLRCMKGNAIPAICRSRREIEQELSRLRTLDEFQLYKQLKSELEEGVAVISTDPELKEGRLYESEDTTMVHADYWEWLKRVAERAKRDLPKKLRNKPLDQVQEARICGAICALDWLLSEENGRLATFLKSTVIDRGTDIG
jgi:hypothetical protein